MAKEFIKNIGDQEIVVQYFEQAQKDKDGNIKWTNKKKAIAKVENKVHSLIYFHKMPDGSLVRVVIPRRQLDEISKTFQEIESRKLQPTEIED